MIRFRLPPDGDDCLAFAYSPLLEATLSLHVLVEPKHHPLQHEWVRRMRTLPAELRREIRRLRFLYDRSVPEFLTQAPAGAYSSFEDELDVLAALDAKTVALGFLRLFWDHGGERDVERLRDHAVRAQALDTARRQGVEPKLVRRIFDDPAGLLASFASLLGAYWEAAFEREWDRLEPLLARTVSDAGARIAEAGVYAYLKGLSPALLIDADARELRRKVPHDHVVAIEPERRLVLAPSFYVWPHVRVNCDDPWPPGIVYPAPFAVAESCSDVPADELLHVLRALGDPTGCARSS